MEHYPTVPGRGLLTQQSIVARLEHLKQLGYKLEVLAQLNMDHRLLQKNIESLVGSVEIPIGIVGPMTVQIENENPEQVFTVAGTLEGALVASMNRGAKAVSLSGGCKTKFFHQRMVRVPMFFFENKWIALDFAQWIASNYDKIKSCVEAFSNHAVLKSCKPIVDDAIVHVEFVYSTGDASGQNMTTTCTWHGIQWIDEQFKLDTGKDIADFIIEGNGSSDKKVSNYLSEHGRGCKVSAKVVLKEEVINRVLRTTSNDLLKCVSASRKRTEAIGMLHYNINVANAIAAIFVATGQDLACIHESSLGELTLNSVEDGVCVELILPSLVVGTVGGGTHLEERQEALEIMGCKGHGKVERFAQLIAAFGLALEISTYAAIVSGEFAKAHEKLGRNKPVDWITKAEINASFVKNLLQPELLNGLEDVCFDNMENEKGILTLLSQRVSKKFIGFIPVDLVYPDHRKTILLKNKANDQEVIKGLQLVAASVNIDLAQLIITYRSFLEYQHCHLKEIEVYDWLSQNEFSNVLKNFSSYIQESREVYLLALERLDVERVLLDSENKTNFWTESVVEKSLQAIATIHLKSKDKRDFSFVKEFNANQAAPFYKHLAYIADTEHTDRLEGSLVELYTQFFELEDRSFCMWKCLIHNDFNPRNIGLIDSVDPIIYDWELAMIHYPQRDVVELLSFVGHEFSNVQIVDFLAYYEKLINSNQEVTQLDWWKATDFCLSEFILTRMSFYVVADVVIETKFAHRVLNQAFRLKKIIKEQLTLHK